MRVLLTVLCSTLLTAWNSSALAEKPNIVLILADDLGYGDLGCYGAPDIRTPVLDQLAREGIRFTSFYSNGPECTPTRTGLLTGRYQHRLGGLECAIGVGNVGRYDDAIRLADQHQLGLPVEASQLPTLLRQAGYRTGLFGKWHLGYEPHFLPMNHGFEKTFGILGGNADYFRHTEADNVFPVLFEDDRPVTREGYLTTLLTDAALQWLNRSGSADSPFFLYLPYTAPHSPIQGPEDDTGMPLEASQWASGPRSTFAEMVEHMDQQIGRIVTASQQQSGNRELLVIFMSDNGADGNGRNAPWSGRKGTTYEGGIRVPCIVRWPKHLPEGRVVNHIAITMDFTASITRIIGEKPQRPFDGVDILREIELDEPASARTLFWKGRRGDRTWKAVRDGRMKRVVRIDGPETTSWLFDLEDDPQEQVDLSDRLMDEAYRLDQLLKDWEREMRASPEFR